MDSRRFTFTKSFSEVLKDEGVRCGCGAGGADLSFPSAHKPDCAVVALYADWTKAARERWDAVKDALPRFPSAESNGHVP